MKKINLMKYFALGLISLSIVSCNIDDDNNGLIPFEAGVVDNPVTISQIAIATPELSILEQALRILEERSDFKPLSELNIPGSTTIFAPTDAAFNAFLTANGIDGISNVPRDVLESIIKNHVLAGEFPSSALTSGYVKTNSLNNENDEPIDLYINTTSGVVLNNNATVTGADVEANNGVIHLIDAVLTQPTVFDLIAANPNFSSLVEAITLADAAADADTATIASIIGELGAEFTIFAPNNAAFASLLQELSLTSLSDVDPSMLRSIVLTHIIGNNMILSSEVVTGTLNSRNNQDLDVDADNLTLTDPRGRVSGIVTSLVDVQGENGVVHEVNTVLLPEAAMMMVTTP